MSAARSSSPGSAARAHRGARWLVAACLVLIAVATLTPDDATEATSSALCLICGDAGSVDALLNVLLFIPFGLGLHLAGVRTTRAIALALAVSVAIEALQLKLIPGRDASVGDVLTNTLGAAAGTILIPYVRAAVLPTARRAPALVVGWCVTWVLAHALLAYSRVDTLPDPPYYGHVGRTLGRGRARFPGTILHADAAGVPIVNDRFAGVEQVRRVLAMRDTLAIRLAATSGGTTRRATEIVSLSGPHDDAILHVAQKGASLLFGIRTGADELRLRPYDFRVDGVFRAGEPAQARADTISIALRYSRLGLDIAATEGNVSTRRALSPRVSDGWRLFMPVQTYIDGGRFELLPAGLFLIVLSAPAGYWLRFAVTGGNMRRRTNLLLAAGVAVALLTGLVAIPVPAGLPAASPWEIAVALCGVTLGTLAAGLASRRLRPLPT